MTIAHLDDPDTMSAAFNAALEEVLAVALQGQRALGEKPPGAADENLTAAEAELVAAVTELVKDMRPMTREELQELMTCEEALQG